MLKRVVVRVCVMKRAQVADEEDGVQSWGMNPIFGMSKLVKEYGALQLLSRSELPPYL